jgi:dsRNA-specific ribonuclease
MAAPTNFVGQLQEMAQFSRWKLPSYHEVERIDEPEGQFVLECQVLDMSSRGYGTTKKSAKQQAAKAMLKQIRDTGVHVAIDSKGGQRALPV